MKLRFHQLVALLGLWPCNHSFFPLRWKSGPFRAAPRGNKRLGFSPWSKSSLKLVPKAATGAEAREILTTLRGSKEALFHREPRKVGFAFIALLVCLASSPVTFRAEQQPKATPTPSPLPAPAPAAPAQTINGSAIAKPRAEYSLPVGQTYVYAGIWRVFNAGTASLRMEKDQTGKIRITGSAEASGTAALLYKVQNRYESFLDPATFCSHSASRQIQEGFRRVDTNISFDYARGKAVLDQKNLKKKESRHEEHPIPGCVTDILSAIYYVASLPLETGKVYNFPLNDGGETITVNVHVEAREQVKTPAGTFSAIRVQPEATSGVLKDKGKIWIWYSDDAARIPVQARAHMYWGTLTFTLLRVDGR